MAVSKKDTSVGLTPEQEEQAWDLYERCGSMADVAEMIGCTFYHVKTALNRDPIRLVETQKVRAESMAARWESHERAITGISGDLLEILSGMIRHIRACTEAGAEFTDLRFRGVPLRPTEAYQWLMETKQLGELGKFGANTAKIAEGMRLIASGQLAGKYGRDRLDKNAGDPAKLSDEELLRMVEDLKASGKPLPFGVEEWVKSQNPSTTPHAPDR